MASTSLAGKRTITTLPGAARGAIGLAALLNLFWAAAFATQQSFAVRLWPWETGRLSYLFMGSMLAAVATAAAWIAVSGEAGSLPAGLLNLAVTLAGIGVFLLVGDQNPSPETWFGVVVTALAVANFGGYLVARRVITTDHEPLPLLLRGSYMVFTLVLVVVGLALILGVDRVMPWPVDPDTSVVFGWIFFGDAWYFAYALVRPDWQRARAQLWSFLGYDLVLIGPLAAQLPRVDDDLLLNLVVYLVVLAYSAALAVWYLLLNPRTRGWEPRRRGPVGPR